MEILENISFVPAAAVGAWDNVEVSPVYWYKENDFCEVCEESEATFFSVYLHQIEGGVQCIADLPTRELAEQLAELIENACNSFVKE